MGEFGESQGQLLQYRKGQARAVRLLLVLLQAQVGSEWASWEVARLLRVSGPGRLA